MGLAALAAGACFPDWDRLDPSNGTAAGGSSQGGDNQGASSAGGSAGDGGQGGGTFCTPGDTAPCYGGPEGTENVGACVGGVTTCSADGSGFGPCEGEVQPETESCRNQIDDDCDGQVNEPDAGCSCTPGELVDCYDGARGTSGVGICGGGQQLCQPNGQGFGTCVGQVLPTHEECGSAADDDCDGEANEGCPLWAKAFGINGEGNDDYPEDAAVTAAGDFWVTGRSQGVLNFGTGDLSPAGSEDLFIAKLDADGNTLFADRWGDASHDIGMAIATDAIGNVYVAGEFGGTLPIDSTNVLTAAGTEDGFVAKLDSAGGVIWAMSIGGAGADVTIFDVAVDATGNIAVTGDFVAASPSVVDFGAGPVSSFGGGRDGFVTKIDAAGTVTWGTSFGESGEDTGRAVVFVGTDLAVAGSFDEEVSLGGPTATDVSGIDGFVGLVDAANTQQWIETVGDGGTQHVYELATDGTNIFAQGDTSGTVNLDGNATAADADDVFAFSLDTSGNYVWHQHYVGPGDQHLGAIAVGGGAVWFAVSHELVVDYGDGPLISAEDDDYALVKLDAATGATLRSVRIGGPGDQDPKGLGLDGSGNVYLAGECEDLVHFGITELDVTNGDEDICLGKLPP